jgi:hypothetical protein
LYISDNKDVLRAELKQSGLAHTAFLSEASKRWNSLGAVERQRYIEMANKQKETYLRA